jgi:asparagine synthetase A
MNNINGKCNINTLKDIVGKIYRGYGNIKEHDKNKYGVNLPK